MPLMDCVMASCRAADREKHTGGQQGEEKGQEEEGTYAILSDGGRRRTVRELRSERREVTGERQISAREKVSTVRDLRVEGSEETTCLSPVMGKYSLSFLPEKMISSALSTLGRT